MKPALFEISEWLDVRESVRQSVPLVPRLFNLAETGCVLVGVLVDRLPSGVTEGCAAPGRVRIRENERYVLDVPADMLTERAYQERYYRLVDLVRELAVQLDIEIPGREVPRRDFGPGGLIIPDAAANERGLLRDALVQLLVEAWGPESGAPGVDPFWNLQLPLLLRGDMTLELDGVYEHARVRLYAIGQRSVS